MNRKILLYSTTATLMVLANSHAKSNCNHDVSNLKCLEYLKNYDGDTATFNVPNLHPLLGNKLKISLNDVRTPNVNSKKKCEKELAKRAKFFTRKILKEAKYIEVTEVKRDRFFGVKGKIKIDGKDLSKQLLNKKYAVANADYKKTSWCK